MYFIGLSFSPALLHRRYTVYNRDRYITVPLSLQYARAIYW